MIEHAGAQDVVAVESLLVEAGLPVSGVRDQFPAAYLVAREGARVVAAGGVEQHGDAGLLRSVVVAPGCGGRGLGARLVARLLVMASERALTRVFLLTMTAAGYFARFGFVPTARASVPAAIAQSSEFASICPASAACLVWSRSPASFPDGRRLPG